MHQRSPLTDEERTGFGRVEVVKDRLDLVVHDGGDPRGAVEGPDRVRLERGRELLPSLCRRARSGGRLC